MEAQAALSSVAPLDVIVHAPSFKPEADRSTVTTCFSIPF